jgi:hypothetical protein
MMKYFFLPVLAGCLLLACNSSDKKHEGHNSSDKAPKNLTDSLLKDIDEGHIVGMSKIGKLHNTQKEVQRVIDSIGKLPAAAQEAAATYVAGLKAVVKDMEYADFAMEKWMMEYSEDSAKENAEQRLSYLKEEKMKVDKMKDAILSSLQKADSLLNIKR